ncbi:uncharacterized protein LOC119781114 [Cyprinodon tularosa]|uniref:uncharacterized protein LOC119781114 n=1 Tax=Cyprinodon tularosa TaxID=77115 RepID=UPI0018E27EB3|nr:uncharacterized protein LOC119781114 [Cyprinodon tularosa]
MKVLVVLFLIFLTGCDAGWFDSPAKQSPAKHSPPKHSPPKHSPPKCKEDLAKDCFWSYVKDCTHTSEESLKEIKCSLPGQYVSKLISQSIEILHKFFQLVYAHIVYWCNELFHRFCHEVDHFQHRVEYYLHLLSDETDHHTKELAERIRCMLDDLKKSVAEYIKVLDYKGLKVDLDKKYKNLCDEVQTCFKHHRCEDRRGHKKECDIKKKVEKDLEDFKITLRFLCYTFEIKLMETSKQINKKVTHPEKKHCHKLDKNSPALSGELKTLWEQWKHFN